MNTIKRLLKIFEFSIMLLVALCLGGIGQKVFADGICEEFSRISPFTTKCQKMYYLPVLQFGCSEEIGGCLDTTVKGKNTDDLINERGDIQFVVNLMPQSQFAPDGKPNGFSGVFSDNKTIPIGVLRFAGGLNLWLKPEWSAEVTFFYPQQGCDEYGFNCYSVIGDDGCLEVKPDYTKIVTGSVLVGFYADKPSHLRGLPWPSTEIHYKSYDGTVEWVTEYPARDPAPGWRFPVKATFDKETSFVFNIGNPFEERDTLVKGILTNQDGEVLGEQTWEIKSRSVVEIDPTAASDAEIPGFGIEAMFPDEKKDLTGWLELEVISPANGGVVPLAFSKVGKAVSIIEIQPFNNKTRPVRSRTNTRGEVVDPLTIR